ncbi:hypothetical protein V3W47_05920 [Deinococcus sp. YIM 134068]|uniref:hypothetical protein n=1 Tax=Deinococcus lichenicola TaxID=3118910 RepID=UPI002F938A56
MKALWLALGAGALGLSFAAGRLSAPSATETARSGLGAALVQVQGQTPTDPNDPREVFPLVPGPGDEPGQGQGQQPGPQQQGQQPGQGECTVLMFKDGQMYRMQPGPGQQPGQQPGPGERGDGQPGSDNELFPIQPFDAPSLPLPGLPPTSAPDMRV